MVIRNRGYSLAAMPLAARQSALIQPEPIKTSGMWK
jgi:hypothetical protein